METKTKDEITKAAEDYSGFNKYLNSDSNHEKWKSFIAGANFANQQTASLRAEVERLREALKDNETRHQEALANQNSYAAYDMELRYESALVELQESIRVDRDIAKGMMGGLAKPVIIAYNSVLDKISKINID